jgi:eukaryotic translation initiation factor 2C
VIDNAIRYTDIATESKIYTIKDFCFDPKWGPYGGNAKNVTFLVRDKRNPSAEPRETSVYEYFKKQYNIDLQYWFLPLVKTEKDGTFPMEVCHLIENQQYKYKTDPEQASRACLLPLNLRLTSSQTAAMIKFAVTRPRERIQAVQHGVQMLKV